MRRFRLPLCLRPLPLLLLFSAGEVRSQDTISVDAVSAMEVCSEKHPASAGPCATVPKPLSKVNPSYPEKARHNRKEGTVTLGLTVNKDGSVSGVHVVTSVDGDIDRAAIDAVNQWKFEPGTYQGSPVDVELNVTVNFRLSTAAPQVPLNENLQKQKDATNDLRNIFSDAVEAYNRGDYATAVNLLRKFTASNSENANAWNELGRALLAMEQFDAASQALQTAIQKDPSSRDAYNNLALVYWRQRKYDDAAAQFRKQIIVNPDDHYAHRNLAMMLSEQHRCSEAMPEFQKALSLTPNHAATLQAQGECDLDLGNRAKGISELEQATSISSAPSIFNGAAYALARRNIELELAEKWSERCLAIENARLQNISLDHLTPEQLNYVFWMSAYWDTRGWIYFLRSDYSKALAYVEPAWWFHTDPTTGDHLGQIYEKLGRPRDAAKVYAMAVASADVETRAKVDMDDLADAKKRLSKLADGNDAVMLKQARVDLNTRTLVLVPNDEKLNATGDFAAKVSSKGKVEFRQLTGDKPLAKFTGALEAAKLSVSLPDSAPVELPLRGTLTCRPEEAQCRFAFLRPEDAVNVARSEVAMATATQIGNESHDPHIYDNPAMGIRVSLPDAWKLVREDQGSISRPHNAMFTKPGSTAMFMLTREHFEGSFDLYQKMLDSYFSQKTEFKRDGQEAVKLGGLTGTRWNVSWNQNGIVYSAVIEMFGVGDDYYRITTLAPKEVYDRYAETFEDVLRSVRFPMLPVDSQLQGPTK